MQSLFSRKYTTKTEKIIEAEIYSATGSLFDKSGFVERTCNGEACGDTVGIWWDCSNTLTGYDGVAELSPITIKTIEDATIIIPEEFKPSPLKLSTTSPT